MDAFQSITANVSVLKKESTDQKLRISQQNELLVFKDATIASKNEEM
jgi:hypothetical protein